MKNIGVVAYFVAALVSNTFGLGLHTRPVSISNNYSENDVGQPLFLTPLIEAGKFDEAKRLSRVGHLKGINIDDLESYTGYLTVNKTISSNIFFWFFPAQENPKDAPVVVWLQGGPGGSSLLGLFLENGPIYIDAHGFARRRNITWNSKFSMLFIDNPVGTGFSFTKDDSGYARNENDVANNLYNALQQFFTLFSEYRKNDFYVTGESYAGKYVPAITYKIYKEGKQANINLKGMAIGDGLCDPITMLGYAPYMFQIGLLDEKQANFLQGEMDKVADMVRSKKYEEAFKLFSDLFFGDNSDGVVPFFTNATGFTFHYNFLIANQPPDFDYYNAYVQTANTRKAIHVGNLTFNNGSLVGKYLAADWMQSVKPWIAEIMDAGYKVMIYNGQLDIIIPYTATLSFIQSIPWDGANDYNATSRQIWKLPGSKDPAGYVRKVRNFTEVLVRDVGHILPYDNPEVAMDMITRYIYDIPFY